MKVKVKRRFRDREKDLKLREEGEVFEVTRGRAEELQKKGFVEEAKEKKETSKQTAG